MSLIARPSPGTPVDQLDTPCLVVDLDALDHNINVIARRYRDATVKLRPHVKNHRCPQLAHLQIAAGGTVGGVCAAKVTEAETMVEADVRQVLVANQVVAPAKIRRLASLALRADVMVAVDDPEQVRRLADGAAALGATIGVVIEVNTSMRRAGIRSPGQGAALARLVAATPGLRFRGVMSHQTIPGFPDRATRFAKAREYFGQVLDVKRAIEATGIPVEIVSTGETWSYDVAAETAGVTEIEGGTYLFMEVPYRYMEEFRIAARVLGTIISRPGPTIAIGDISLEALGAPRDLPSVDGLPGVTVESLTPDHTVLRTEQGSDLAVGDRYALLTHQQDITMSRWDQYVVARDGVVVGVWDVTARGCHN